MAEVIGGGEKWWSTERKVTLYQTPEGEIVLYPVVTEDGMAPVYGYAIERRKIPGFGDWRMDESTIRAVERVVNGYMLADRTFMSELEMPDGFFDDMQPVATATAAFNPETWSYEVDMESVELSNP